MPIIPWDKKLETEIPLIDNQHKQFLLKANLFNVKCKVNKSFEPCEEDLSFLETILLSHFQAEEALQSECDYPQFHRHQASHDHLRLLAKEIGFQLRTSAFGAEALEIFCAFVGNEVKEHISLEDLKFAKYYHETM